MITIHGIKLAAGSEALNMVIEHRPDDPTDLHEGRVWFNTTTNQMKFCDHTLNIQIISISNYDIYQGNTPPGNTEQLWFKDDDKILFDYNPTLSKWYSVQKVLLDFNLNSRIYSGYFEERHYIKYPATVKSIRSSYSSKVLSLRSDGVETHQFSSPYNETTLDVELNAGTVLTLYTPTEFVSNNQLFIENTSVYVELAWRSP
jgi:hypothetical protein